MRQFYLAFPIRHALRDESGRPARLPANAPRPALSWTHYRLLLGVDDARARDRYSVLSEGRQIFAAKYVKVLPVTRQASRSTIAGRNGT